MPIQNFNDNELWQILSSVAQNANDFNADDMLTMSTIVKSVVGSGPAQLTEVAVDRKLILKITNNGDLRLPRTLAVAYDYTVRGHIRSDILHS